MFKKIVIFGLLAFAQVSLGMEGDVSVKEIEKEYAQLAIPMEQYKSFHDFERNQNENKITVMQCLHFAKDAFCFMGTKEFRDALKRELDRQEIKDAAKSFFDAIPSEYAKSYAAAFSLIFSHEVGHWSFSRVLLKDKGFIWISPLQFLPWVGFKGVHYHMPTGEVIKHFMNNPKDIFKAETTVSELAKYYHEVHLKDKLYSRRAFATMLAAGPISGCLASYLLLKGNTFLNEYEKNGRSIKSAWQETQERSLFNRDQNFLLQIIAAMNLQGNLFGSLYPWGNTTTRDGDRLFQVLNIKNPRPLLRKSIGMGLGTFLFCSLSKSIFDAWKDKF